MAQKGLAGHQVCVAVCCSVLVCVAVCCGVLRAQPDPFARRDMTVDCNTHYKTLQHTATHCNTLQHTATHCNTLQYTATHCNTLQHAATHCNTLHHTRTAPHCHETRVFYMKREICLFLCRAPHVEQTHMTHMKRHVSLHQETHVLTCINEATSFSGAVLSS